MRWLVFGIVSYVGLALQIGLQPVLSVSAGSAGVVTPSFLLVILVYVGLMAPERVVGWTALILGLLSDLISPVGVASGGAMGGDVVIIGPMAIGFLVGGYALVQMRGYVFRKSVLSLAAMVLVVGVFVELVSVALLTMRGWPWLAGEVVPGWVPADQLVRSFFTVLYSVALALVIGWLLMRSEWMWGFSAMAGRGAGIYGQRR